MNRWMRTRWLWALILTMGIGGCVAGRGRHEETHTQQGPGMEAAYIHDHVIVDGWLDEEVWKQAKVYHLGLANDQAALGKQVQEAGSVRLVWDDQYLYVAVEFEDVDIVAEGQSDQLPHFQFGDLCEVFLKPEKETWYWELYVTPHSRMSSYWFPGRGRFGLPSNFQYSCGLRVAAKVDGSINNWRDKDARWTAEMAMPLRDLTAHGETFGPGSSWRILVARYNYSRYRSERGPELTMTPSLSETNFHMLEEYTPLRLVR